MLEECLERIAAPNGEGSRTFVRVFANEARATADACDARRGRAESRRPLEGKPVSIKDLCDVEGVVTLAGSTVRAASTGAERCVGVQRLRAAGAVIVGTTNMSEFAMGTTGTNRLRNAAQSMGPRHRENSGG